MIEAAKNLWELLQDRMQHRSGAVRLVRILQEQSIGEATASFEVTPLKDAVFLEKALEMMTAQVEQLALCESASRATELMEIKRREFWLTLFEKAGVENHDDLLFDPNTCSIRRRSGIGQHTTQPSYQSSLEGYRQLISAALTNPLAAGQMARDICLPSWLQELARAITTGDLRPALREVIQECLDDPKTAGRWSDLAKESELPDWIIRMAELMAKRKKPVM
jgi:hypothetical protein